MPRSHDPPHPLTFAERAYLLARAHHVLKVFDEHRARGEEFHPNETAHPLLSGLRARAWIEGGRMKLLVMAADSDAGRGACHLVAERFFGEAPLVLLAEKAQGEAVLRWYDSPVVEDPPLRI